jgi:hypothetical protein
MKGFFTRIFGFMSMGGTKTETGKNRSKLSIDTGTPGLDVECTRINIKFGTFLTHNILI